MAFERILLKRSAEFATITMNRAQRSNALPLARMRELISAFTNSAVWSHGRNVNRTRTAVLLRRHAKSTTKCPSRTLRFLPKRSGHTNLTGIGIDTRT